MARAGYLRGAGSPSSPAALSCCVLGLVLFLVVCGGTLSCCGLGFLGPLLAVGGAKSGATEGKSQRNAARHHRTKTENSGLAVEAQGVDKGQKLVREPARAGPAGAASSVQVSSKKETGLLGLVKGNTALGRSAERLLTRINRCSRSARAQRAADPPWLKGLTSQIGS